MMHIVSKTTSLKSHQGQSFLSCGNLFSKSQISDLCDKELLDTRIEEGTKERREWEEKGRMRETDGDRKRKRDEDR